MKNVIFVIGVLLSWYGCSDDNTGTLPISDVTRTTFVDERDMTTYQCIVVNGQTWMAENLRYRLPLGASEGCYTFMRCPYLFQKKIYCRSQCGFKVRRIGGSHAISANREHGCCFKFCFVWFYDY